VGRRKTVEKYSVAWYHTTIKSHELDKKNAQKNHIRAFFEVVIFSFLGRGK
jgi:hypothetical protein